MDLNLQNQTNLLGNKTQRSTQQNVSAVPLKPTSDSKEFLQPYLKCHYCTKLISKPVCCLQCMTNYCVKCIASINESTKDKDLFTNSQINCWVCFICRNKCPCVPCAKEAQIKNIDQPTDCFICKSLHNLLSLSNFNNWHLHSDKREEYYKKANQILLLFQGNFKEKCVKCTHLFNELLSFLLSNVSNNQINCNFLVKPNLIQHQISLSLHSKEKKLTELFNITQQSDANTINNNPNNKTTSSPKSVYSPEKDICGDINSVNETLYNHSNPNSVFPDNKLFPSIPINNNSQLQLSSNKILDIFIQVLESMISLFIKYFESNLLSFKNIMTNFDLFINLQESIIVSPTEENCNNKKKINQLTVSIRNFISQINNNSKKQMSLLLSFEQMQKSLLNTLIKPSFQGDIGFTLSNYFETFKQFSHLFNQQSKNQNDQSYHFDLNNDMDYSKQLNVNQHNVNNTKVSTTPNPLDFNQKENNQKMFYNPLIDMMNSNTSNKPEIQKPFIDFPTFVSLLQKQELPFTSIDHFPFSHANNFKENNQKETTPLPEQINILSGLLKENYFPSKN